MGYDPKSLPLSSMALWVPAMMASKTTGNIPALFKSCGNFVPLSYIEMKIRKI
jgi:hypothetical protein